jgi:3-ketosteroid 9alpha-monooxygenase subunit A
MKSEPSIPAEGAALLAYPEGWFQVAYSADVARGQVVRLHYFGRELVLFRTESGAIQVLDAYCAHLGAHLGVGGKVIGEHLRCPFHAWEYGADGRCKKIPYSPQIPQAAAVATWPTKENSGLVLVWHSSVGNPPLWDAPELPEYGDPAWEGYIRYDWTINTSAQEICENAVDISHIPAVHGGNRPEEEIRAVNFGIPPFTVNFERHIFDCDFSIDPKSDTYHRARYYGLGLSISRSAGRGAKLFWTSRTPVEPDKIEVRYSMLTASSAPGDPTGAISRAAARFTAEEFVKDVPIWNNKIYRPTPLLCKGDGPIGRFRIWAGQFYPSKPTPTQDTERTRTERPAEIQRKSA